MTAAPRLFPARKDFLTAVFILCASLASVQAAPQNFANYEGSYKGTWTFQSEVTGVPVTSSVGTVSMVISSARKGKSGKVALALGPIIFASIPEPADATTITFANSVMSLDNVVPSILSRQPATGIFTFGKKSIDGRLALFISSTAVNLTLKLTTHRTKRRQTVRLVYDGLLVTSGSLFTPIHYIFDVSRRVRR
jgi:hypothetical protein